MTAEQNVRAVIEEHEGTSNFDLTTTWKELGADSLDVVEIVLMFEDRVNAEISKEDGAILSDSKTIGEFVKIAEKYC
jgi:acyl carrier protein